MRSRLVLSTAAIALAAVIMLGVPLGAVEAARLRQESDEPARARGRRGRQRDRRPARAPPADHSRAAAPLRPGRPSRHRDDPRRPAGDAPARRSAARCWPRARARRSEATVSGPGADRGAQPPRLPRVAADRRARHRRRADRGRPGAASGPAPRAAARGDRAALGASSGTATSRSAPAASTSRRSTRSRAGSTAAPSGSRSSSRASASSPPTSPISCARRSPRCACGSKRPRRPTTAPTATSS